MSSTVEQTEAEGDSTGVCEKKVLQASTFQLCDLYLNTLNICKLVLQHREAGTQTLLKVTAGVSVSL